MSIYNKENNQLDATIGTLKAATHYTLNQEIKFLYIKRKPVHPHPSQQQATYKVLHTTGCIIQSNAPEDWHNYCLKHVELTLES